MQVTVVLYANLGQYHPQGEGNKEFTLEVPSGANPGMVLDLLQIPVEEYKLVFVHNQRRALDYPLAEGDRVALFPPVGGG